MKLLQRWVAVIVFSLFLHGAAVAQALWQAAVEAPGAQLINGGAQLDDGSFLITGLSTEVAAGDLLAARIDADGQLLWQRTYSLSGLGEQGWDVIALGNGEAIIIGSANLTGTGGDNRPWLLRVDAHGDVLWSTEHGLTAELTVDSALVRGVLTRDGRLVIAGGANTFTDVQDPWFASVDLHDGSLIDFVTFPPVAGPGFGVATYLLDLGATPDGGLIATGAAAYTPGSTFVWKLDAHFNEQWQRTYEGEDLYRGEAISVVDGGFWVSGAGFSNDGAALLRLNDHGDVLNAFVFAPDEGYAEGQDHWVSADDTIYLLRNSFPAFGSLQRQAQLLEVLPDGTLVEAVSIDAGGVGTSLQRLISATHPSGLLALGYARQDNNGADAQGFVARREIVTQMVFAESFEQD